MAGCKKCGCNKKKGVAPCLTAVAAPICYTPFRDLAFCRPVAPCATACAAPACAPCAIAATPRACGMLPAYGRSGYAGGALYSR